MSALDYNQVEEVLINWLREKVEVAGARGTIVGLSGGIDSAVTAALCKKAFPREMMGILMPCHSSGRDAADARLLAETFEIEYQIKDLSPVFDKFLELIGEQGEDKMATANIKPRLRMMTLYYYAARRNYLVIGTDNWSELTIGYFTKYGDGGVDLAPLGRLVKTEVRELARHLGVPEGIIKKAPSAGLWSGQTDEDEMGFSYENLDQYILTGEADPADREKIEAIVNRNAHKTQPIPIPARDILLDEG